MIEKNKEIVLAYVDAFNRCDLNALSKLFTPDALIYGVLGWGDLEKAKPIWKELHECLNTSLHVEEIVAEGSILAVRYTERGKSVQSFRGGPVTGKSYEVVAMEWFEMKDGLIHRRWGARDWSTMAKQMGFS
jgi:steroid delta-isomerase-like uncharacterized protein